MVCNGHIGDNMKEILHTVCIVKFGFQQKNEGVNWVKSIEKWWVKGSFSLLFNCDSDQALSDWLISVWVTVWLLFYLWNKTKQGSLVLCLQGAFRRNELV